MSSSAFIWVPTQFSSQICEEIGWQGDSRTIKADQITHHLAPLTLKFKYVQTSEVHRRHLPTIKAKQTLRLSPLSLSPLALLQTPCFVRPLRTCCSLFACFFFSLHFTSLRDMAAGLCLDMSSVLFMAMGHLPDAWIRCCSAKTFQPDIEAKIAEIGRNLFLEC
jgi:hypothetical protein